MKVGQLFTALIIAAVFLVSNSTVFAVARLVPGQYSTIQAAIDDANNGDTVVVADGTYTGDGNRDIDFKGKAITVRSENGPENCIIDCNSTETDRHRGFLFHSGEDANSAIIGFTITNGYAPVEVVADPFYPFWLTEASIGGAIVCYYSSPTISTCTIRGNQAIGVNPYHDGGGGIACYGYYEYSNPTISNCTFSGNSAGYGGGGVACFWDSNPTITNCTFSGNSSSNHGGGIACYGWWGSSSSPTPANCTFVGNSAHRGGGMYNLASSPMLTNCTFSGNVAQDTGGAIANDKYSNFTFTNCTFSGNKAPNGNAISCDSYEQAYPSTVQLVNCILWDGGDEIWNNDNSVITITYSDVQDGWPGAGNLDIDPCFVEPGYWDANNTPDDANDDFWVDGDYHLRWDSPCIDVGDPGYIPQPSDTDIDGEPRVMRDSRVDMGSDEVGPKQADFTRNGIIDALDLSVFLESWLAVEGDANWYVLCDLFNNQQIDMMDYAQFAADWLWQAEWYED